MGKRTINKKDYGNVHRMSYQEVEEIIEMPNLVEVQKESYKWFLEEGLDEAFKEISPIESFDKKMAMEFVGFKLKDEPNLSIEECKERATTYSTSMNVKARLHIRSGEETEIREEEIHMGDFPLMTETGTFIINGAERVIVSQLVRSPGIYYNMKYDKVGKQLITATVIPSRGAWIEYETDSNDIFSAHVDRTRKVPVTVLMRALGLGTDQEILELFGDDPKIIATIEKDATKSREEGLIELYKKIRPGEPPTIDSASSLLNSMFYDSKRYSLARVGRYKFNKKLSFETRIIGTVLAEDVESLGEVVAKKGELITEEMAIAIQNSGVHGVSVNTKARKNVKVISNRMVDAKEYLAAYDIDPSTVGINENVFYPALVECLEDADIENSLKENINSLIPKHIILDDILASMSYVMNLDYAIGRVDDIDHLGNRRIRAVGELLQNQYRIGLTRLEKSVKERMTINVQETMSPKNLINIRPVTGAMKEFFGSSQLSQYMDHNNPLSELTHKRRLSALGPGGLSRDRAGFEVRDVHFSHFGRMCPIESPEGPNIGLINALSTYARINEYGFIEAPYLKLAHEDGKTYVTNEVMYLSADDEEEFAIAQANEKMTSDGYFANRKVVARFGEDIKEVNANEVDLIDVSPKQMVSVATALIPFLENDESTRALMGANMQRQAVPLLKADSPIVGTGMEYKVAKDSGVVVIAKEDGVVERVTANEIIVRNVEGGRNIYKLTKFIRSNQGTCINQKPIVEQGQEVKRDDVLADGPSTEGGELALGRNPLIAFMNWEGYNYEDAILLSEKLVEDDVYTSIHIEEYTLETRETKLGTEVFTRDIPNVGDALKNLDENGIIRIGAEVKPGDILIGKVTPKGETELTAEERLLRAIFGEKAREVRDNSLRVPNGATGIIIDVKTFSRKNGDNELSPGVNESATVYIAQKRKISVGDKMAGRHGNKGVISRILPVEDMPFLPNGRPVDIVLNPLGVPSRMNIGQILEVHLGLASKALGWKVATPVFDGATEIDIMETLEIANDYVNFEWEEFTEKWKDKLSKEVFDDLEENKDHRTEWQGVPLNSTGKIKLRDGRSGDEFDNPVTVGYMHYLKLHHLVDDKIHARSTGPYSLVTQQPLGGKAQFGGQRFGEMEVWALEAYGAAYTLQEILTVKSDDIVGRVNTYEAIVKGENIPEPGVPESFKVLLKELQALCLDVRLLREDMSEVMINDTYEEPDDLNDFYMDDAEKKERENASIRQGDDSVLENNMIIDEDAPEDDSDDDFNMDLDFDDDDEDLADFEYEEDLEV
ncbi:MAG: DNA-directed RNA polymerase subunit beta [Lachnospirales bacterium]